MLITLDIETLPSENATLRAELAKDIAPPGNMTKADTIAAWEADKKPGLIDQAMRKTSFDGAYGRILCVGWAVDDAEPQTVIGEEPHVLANFVRSLGEALAIPVHGGEIQQSSSITFVGHNIAGFDLRFLYQRCAINRVNPPSALLAACRARPWDSSIADTMLIWNPEREKRISLNKLCKALCVQTSKSDMDGSKVYDEYKAGNLIKIADYCARDVAATRECYRRLVFA